VNWPQSLEEAFDLSTPKVLDWEVELLRMALKERRIRFEVHSLDRLLERNISPQDVSNVLAYGQVVSKDMGGSGVFDRRPGINFEGLASGNRQVRVKVSWFQGYVIVTVHVIGG
jgi:hypothetical protein